MKTLGLLPRCPETSHTWKTLSFESLLASLPALPFSWHQELPIHLSISKFHIFCPLHFPSIPVVNQPTCQAPPSIFTNAFHGLFSSAPNSDYPPLLAFRSHFLRHFCTVTYQDLPSCFSIVQLSLLTSPDLAGC